MKMRVNFIVSMFMLSVSLQAQDRDLYLKKSFVFLNDTLPYRILMPDQYDPAKQYPLVLFLHGSGERGNDNEKQLVHGADLFLRDSIRNRYPAFIVFPQCSLDGYWSNVIRDETAVGRARYTFRSGGTPTRDMAMLQRLLRQLLIEYPVNRRQVYAGGLSMGAMGTYELVRRSPGVFAAAFAICGGAHPATAAKLKNLPWWIFHGGKDDVVIPAFSEAMVQALRKKKVRVKYTVYPDANHNSWDRAFAEPLLLSWLFAQKKQADHLTKGIKHTK